MKHNTDNLIAYLAGQQDFIDDQAQHQREAQHACQRCQRPCKARFTHCWRCRQYLLVREKTAKGSYG